jgi:hypothetical protein
MSSDSRDVSNTAYSNWKLGSTEENWNLPALQTLLQLLAMSQRQQNRKAFYFCRQRERKSYNFSPEKVPMSQEEA